MSTPQGMLHFRHHDNSQGPAQKCEKIAFSLAATALEHIKQSLDRLIGNDLVAKSELLYQIFIARVVLGDEVVARQALKRTRACTPGAEKLEKAWEAARGGDECAMIIYIIG